MNRTANHKAQAALAAIFVLSLAFMAAGTASATAIAPRNQYLRYGFSETLSPWEGKVYYEPAATIRVASSGPYQVLGLGGPAKDPYAQLVNRGGKAVWMYASFKATASLLHVSFDAIPVYAAWSLIPVVYVGREGPDGLIGFQKLGTWLDQGRQTLSFMVDLHQAGLEGSRFVIALGFVNYDYSQAKQIAAFDNVRVVIDDGE